jgi:hypothetical protein
MLERYQCLGDPETTDVIFLCFAPVRILAPSADLEQLYQVLGHYPVEWYLTYISQVRTYLKSYSPTSTTILHLISTISTPHSLNNMSIITKSDDEIDLPKNYTAHLFGVSSILPITVEYQGADCCPRCMSTDCHHRRLDARSQGQGPRL